MPHVQRACRRSGAAQRSAAQRATKTPPRRRRRRVSSLFSQQQQKPLHHQATVDRCPRAIAATHRCSGSQREKKLWVGFSFLGVPSPIPVKPNPQNARGPEVCTPEKATDSPIQQPQMSEQKGGMGRERAPALCSLAPTDWKNACVITLGSRFQVREWFESFQSLSRIRFDGSEGGDGGVMCGRVVWVCLAGVCNHGSSRCNPPPPPFL